MSAILNGEDARFMPLLALTERPRSDADLTDTEAEGPVTYALGCGSVWWAERALDWVDQGVAVPAVLPALRRAVDDDQLPQPVRHRALRLASSQA
jgi:hypothetical protein